MNIIIFLIILLVLVIVHEFGHFYSAKKFGIRVDEFGFGFPPKLLGIKKGETEYTFNALPFGGFVKIFGENPDEASISGPDSSRSFVSKPKWQQAIVLFAGVFANFILAWFLFSIGFMSGMPTSVSSDILEKYDSIEEVNTVIISVMPDSPAEKAGLRSGDKIIHIGSASDRELNRNNSVEPDAIRYFIAGHGGKEIEIKYVRGSNYEEVNSVKMTPSAQDGTPKIGISMDEIGIAKLPLIPAFIEGMKLNWNVTKGTVVGLYGLIADSLSGNGSFASVTGPVGMVGIVGDAYQFGFAYLLSFAALISINLAIINLLPFPALDGGRLFFLLIEKIKGSALNPKFANTANTIGFSLLILLMVAVTYHDIAKLF